MANWDGVVTDPRLTLDLVEGHLAGLEGDAYLFDQLPRRASGGSTGRRGIFAYGWREWAAAYAGFLRPASGTGRAPELAAVPMRIAMVGARNATHMTSAMPQTFANPSVDIALFPVTQPIGQIVAGLNAYQPLALKGYLDGPWPPRPAPAGSGSQADHHHQRAPAARGAPSAHRVVPRPVANMYGTSEAGPMGIGCWRGPGIHLCDDLVIGRAGRPGRPPGPARRPLRQALRDRHLQPDPAADPFELTDQVTFRHAVCLRLRPPADRRRGEPPGRPLQLPGRPGGAPARLRRTAPPRPGDHRVPGPPDPGRRRGPGRRGPGRSPPPAAWSPPSWPAWASPTRPSRSASSTGWSGRRPGRSGGSARWRRSAGRLEVTLPPVEHGLEPGHAVAGRPERVSSWPSPGNSRARPRPCAA